MRRTVKLHAAAILAGLLLVIAGIVLRLEQRRSLSASRLSAMLPQETAVLAYLDCRVLRASGLMARLTDSLVRESEYQDFVRGSGLDPVRDLDLLAVSFHPTGIYFALAGRIDWTQLRRFTTARGGRCEARLCMIQGSQPERKISFVELRSHLMALAVAPDARAALRIRENVEPLGDAPEAPAWLMLSGSTIRRLENLPVGTRVFATALASSQRIAFSVAPQQNRLRLNMQVVCRSPEDAGILKAQLEGLTATLRKMIALERKQPNPRDLSGVLTRGEFSTAGASVYGSWPLEPEFLESLTGS